MKKKQTYNHFLKEKVKQIIEWPLYYFQQAFSIFPYYMEVMYTFQVVSEEDK